MPIYEYHCAGCGKDHEIIQKINDPLLKICPVCGKTKLTKKISMSGFQLKGGGWYKDGYTSSKPADSKPPDTKSPDTKTSEEKQETKSEVKKETKPAVSPKSSEGEK